MSPSDGASRARHQAPTHAAHAIGYATGVALFAVYATLSRPTPSCAAPR